VSIFLLGIFISFTLDSDFGRLEVRSALIADGNRELSGLLYRPSSASTADPSSAIVLVHEIDGSKEMISGIRLELARQGFVALCLDSLEQGVSGGSVQAGTSEPSFRGLSAGQYLRSQSFVNASTIGLVGHSLGRIQSKQPLPQMVESVSVLIAGGFDEIPESPAYGVLNSTFPKDLLVIVGNMTLARIFFLRVKGKS
jgi:hypothetical protein